jgi:hypothetical protein
MVHFVPTTVNVTAKLTAALYMDHVFKLHGLAVEFVSDRGTQFNNAFMQRLTRLLGTKQAMSTAYHPQTDGQTERINRVMEEMLRHFVSPRQDDWDEYLATAEFAVNNAKHASTKASPFYLVYGRNPRTPADVNFPALEGKGKHAPAADEFASQLALGTDHAKSAMQSAQARQKHNYDQGKPELALTVGDMVLLNTKNLSVKGPGTRKLMPRWLGPFEVTRVVNPVAYTLALPPTMRIHPTFHVSLLKRYMAGGRVQPPVPPIDLEGEEYFLIDHIVRHDTAKNGRRKYLIKWQGSDQEHNTWEPEVNILPSEEGKTLRKYWAYIGQPLPKSLEKALEDQQSGKDDECEICHSTGSADQMLLCDTCDTGWHMYCLDPPLTRIPDGAWRCPKCAPNSTGPTMRHSTGPADV